MPFPFFMNANQDSLNISYRQFRENKCVMAFSFEKMQDVILPALKTKIGSLTMLKVKGTEGNLAETEHIQEVFVNLVSESVLELTESGAIVYDY